MVLRAVWLVALWLDGVVFKKKCTRTLTLYTTDTDSFRNEHSSSMTVVASGQNAKTYPTTKCKFWLSLKMGYLYSFVAPRNSALNSGKQFGGIVYRHLCLSLAAKQTVRLETALRKNNKKNSCWLELLASIVLPFR